MLAAGCSSSSSKASASDQKVTITFWHSYSADSEVPSDQDGDPGVRGRHPGITVKSDYSPYDDLYQKLLTGVAAGELPDVVRSDIVWGRVRRSSACFGRSTARSPTSRRCRQATFPGNLSTNFYQGHYYGLPLDTNTRIMYANQAAFASAGITTLPATFADLVADAPKLKAKGIDLYGEGGTGGWNILPWIWSNGGALTNDDYSTSTGYINGPASVQAVQMLANLYKAGSIPNIILGAQGGVATSDGLPKANYAMILDGPWMNPIWAGSYPNFKPVEAPVPAGAAGSISVVGGEDINMLSTTKHKDAVEKFISFMLSPAAQLDMTQVGQLSVRQDLRSQVTQIQPYYAQFLTQLATAKARTPVANYPKIDTVLSTQFAKAISGQEPVQKAMDEAAAQIDPLLK